MCVACYVDEETKDKIIAYSAKFHEVTQSPYGSDDEIGMLHLIDGASRSAILSRADASKMFDLSVDNFVGMPGWFGAGDQPYQIWMTHTPRGEIAANSMGVSLEANQLVAYSGDGISMYTHCGTHIDTFNHFGYNGKIFNGFSVDEHLGSRAWTKCGAEKHPPILARGVLLDIAAHARRRQAAAKPRHRQGGPRRLPEAPGHGATPGRRRADPHRADDVSGLTSASARTRPGSTARAPNISPSTAPS